MKNLRSEIIKFSRMFNSKKLSALRSGNISARYKDGFLVTPSGKKYSSLKDKDLIKKFSGPVLLIIKELLLGKSIEMFSNAGILIENPPTPGIIG